jgi:hypothetical protein
MDEKKIKQFYTLFTELWKIFKKYSDPDDSDEFWQGLRDEMAALNDYFRDQGDEDLKDTAEKLAVSTMLSIQNIYRRKEGRM